MQTSKAAPDLGYQRWFLCLPGGLQMGRLPSRVVGFRWMSEWAGHASLFEVHMSFGFGFGGSQTVSRTLRCIVCLNRAKPPIKLILVSTSFLLLVVRPLFLVAMPFAPSSVLAPTPPV